MSSDQQGNLAGSYWSGYDVLWGLNDPGPSRRTAFDRSQVIAAAIDIADHSGLAAVTMRSVSTALGTAPMSLYRHVPDKDALVSMMVDAIIAGSVIAHKGERLPEGWREQLVLIARSTWELCRLHRWYPEACIIRPPITPSGVAGFEFALSIFDDFDLDIATKAQFVGSVHSTVVSAALNTAIEENSRARVAMTKAEVFAQSAPFVQRLIESGEYPRVTKFITSAVHLDDEERMLAAVELILDGIAARLDAISRASLL